MLAGGGWTLVQNENMGFYQFTFSNLHGLLYRDLKDKTMADNLMYIPNDNTQNYPFCRIKLMV